MRIDYYHNKKNGNTYVYQAESYYDPAKKRCGTRRKLIGKLGENGEVIPTGKRGRPPKQPSVDAENAANPAPSTISSSGISAEEVEQGEDIALLHAELARLQIENLELRRIIDSIAKAVSGYSTQQ